MALLGTFIDKKSLQTLGGGAGANFFQTIAHQVATNAASALGSTNPDTGLVVVRSVEVLTGVGLPYYFGANASIATLGYAFGSGAPNASVGLCAVDCYNIYFHSPIR